MMKLAAFCIALLCAFQSTFAANPQCLNLPGKDGPGKGKNVVLVGAANEYNPELALPLLAHILSERHGFNCTVCFSLDKSGEFDTNVNDNIPGLEALDNADLLIILCRFQRIPDEQMKHVVDYLEAGKPVIGLRTATHSFDFPGNSKTSYAKYTWTSKEPGFEGGFGRVVLGETWITHHAPNGSTSTRALIVKSTVESPILRGIGDGEIWASTGVYGIRLPLPESCTTLLLGQVLDGPHPTDKPKEGKLNEPMMPVAWSKTYSVVEGKTGRAFTTTMGSGADLEKSEALRRLLVNAAYWATGLEDKIPAKADVDLVPNVKTMKKGLKPADIQP